MRDRPHRVPPGRSGQPKRNCGIRDQRGYRSCPPQARLFPGLHAGVARLVPAARCHEGGSGGFAGRRAGLPGVGLHAHEFSNNAAGTVRAAVAGDLRDARVECNERPLRTLRCVGRRCSYPSIKRATLAGVSRIIWIRSVTDQMKLGSEARQVVLLRLTLYMSATPARLVLANSLRELVTLPSALGSPLRQGTELGRPFRTAPRSPHPR